MSRLEGKIALVTGAARGIGHEVATLFAEHGALVLATDVLDPVADYPVGVTYARQDVTSQDEWSSVVNTLIDTHGAVDILINNAGGSLGNQEMVADLELDDWNRVIALNQTSVFLGMREVIPHMQRAGGGAIVNFSSAYGIAAVARLAAYQTVKAAVRHLSKVAAVAYAPDGIRVNSIHPGLTKTPGTDEHPPESNAAVLAATPLGRIGLPRDVANGCLFLASDESSFVTGTELVIDGGYLALGDPSGGAPARDAIGRIA